MHPMGALKTLDLQKTLWEQNVGHLSKLVLLGIKSFGWDRINKGPAMQLSNEDKTVNRGSSTLDYETILASLGFSSGRHYWEIKIDEFGIEEDIWIGVAKAGIKTTQHPDQIQGMTWGWQCTSGRKTWWPQNDKPQSVSYGDYSSRGEVIGVLLELSQQDGLNYMTLTYYRNGKNLGHAYQQEHIYEGLIYPCVSLLNNQETDVRVTLIPCAKIPDDDGIPPLPCSDNEGHGEDEEEDEDR